MRPEPWENPDPEHFHFEPSEATPEWELVKPADSRPCRFTVARGVLCKQPSVARLNRSRHSRTGTKIWWHYCTEHLYGRWVEDGKILQWKLAPNICQARECEQPGITAFSDGAGQVLWLCEDHGDLLAVGFPLKIQERAEGTHHE